MISFNYELDFKLDNERMHADWLSSVVSSESKIEGELNYIFCDDIYLLKINNEFLLHDTLTDIISFDYSIGNILHGDMFISIERVHENASNFKVTFNEELKRVMVHGVLHYCGYNDKCAEDEVMMRHKEEEKMKMFHVKQF